MGMSKEKFMELEDRISHMTDEDLRRLEFIAHVELMSRDLGLDDFLCEAQADECAVHQPVNEINASIPF